MGRDKKDRNKREQVPIAGESLGKLAIRLKLITALNSHTRAGAADSVAGCTESIIENVFKRGVTTTEDTTEVIPGFHCKRCCQQR